MANYEGYCVKCREKREFDGQEVEMANGRRAAQGTCPVCGTKMNRILGKAKVYPAPAGGRAPRRRETMLGMHELIIKAGTVVDGTGAPARAADVAVDAGRITEVGPALGAATRTIDADGLLVTPGWVDVHTHYDGQVRGTPSSRRPRGTG